MDKTAVIAANMLASLRALRELYLSNHWVASGPTSYSDHLLFQRLYEPLDEQVDTLAEKLVAIFGPDIVNPARQSAVIHKCLRVWTEHRGELDASIFAEQSVQQMLSRCYNALKDADRLTLGMDDFLMSCSSAHDTAIYLLRQRLAG